MRKQRSSRKDKKVAILLQDLAGGGAERIMLRLAGGLSERGLDVDLVLVRQEGPFLSDVPSTVRVVHLGKRRTAESIFPLIRYLRRERPTALLSALTHVNVTAILACRLALCGTRVIVTEHNTISKEVAANSDARVKWAYRMVPWIYAFAHRIIAVSHGVAEDLGCFSGLDPRRIDVVYNPIVTPELAEMAAQPPVHPWFVSSDRPVILAVGRLTRQKDFSILLRAFSLVRRERPARLVIVGEGPDRSKLESLVEELGLQDCVDLPGFLKNPFSLMARSRVFVLSSAWEGLPTVLVEALACGTPVVATDCPSGPKEILEEGCYGPLVPVGDSESLAHAIIDTMEHPLPADHLQGRAARFSAKHSVNCYKDILLDSHAD